MCNLTSSVPSAAVQVDQPVFSVLGPIGLKMSGLPGLFNPSQANSTSPNFQMLLSNPGKYGIILQTFLQFRKDSPSLENSKGSSVYYIDLDKSESLEGDDEFSETLYGEREDSSKKEKEERAKKMWQKARTTLLESLRKKSKAFSVLSVPVEDNSFFSLLSKK